MNLEQLVMSSKREVGAIAKHLDQLGHSERVRETRALPRAALQRLFETVRNFRPVTLENLVPAKAPAYTPVHHIGTNNLPLARGFEKIMYREAHGGVAGYNAQMWRWATGPGYFTAHQDGAEIRIDYSTLPQSIPPGWPAIRSNRVGLSYFVYRDLNDQLRGVSQHVTIGHATRGAQNLPNYFILVRDEASLVRVAQPARSTPSQQAAG